MASITRGYANTRFGQVHYRTAGERRPGQLPLVLLHQTPSSSVMFERVMALLAEDFWMVAPDTPGFGGTEAPVERPSVALYARAMAAALRCLDVGRCFLFGHHAGASIAAQMTCDGAAAVEKLALSAPPLLTKADLERVIPTVSPAQLEPDGGHLMAVWRRICAKEPDAPVDLVHREAVLNLHAGVRYQEAYSAVFEHDLAGELARITCPTLVMCGPSDPLAGGAGAARDRLRQGELIMFPVGGALICDTHPELVADALRGFFRA